MPTYEYHCDNCEHHFDEFQSMSEEPLKKCPACGKKKLRRLFGAGAGIIFKGSGFYQTDYRSESYKSAAKSEQEAAKPAKSGDGSTGANGASTPKGGKAGQESSAAPAKSQKSAPGASDD